MSSAGGASARSSSTYSARNSNGASLCHAVVATGDEVLSWREMRARYAACRLRVVEGSDHALSDFDEHLPAVLAFLGLG